MSFNHLDADLAHRRRWAEARWTGLVTAKPYLARAIGLQRRTIGAQLDLLSQLGPILERTPIPPETLVLRRLADRVPVLRAGIGPLPVHVLAPAMIDLARSMTAASGYAAARRVADALASGDVDPARLLALIYQRDQDGVRQLAAGHALAVDMLWLVGDIAVGPAVHLQQIAALREDEPDSPVREALERWDQGFCPACGSWPALAEFFYGERLLRCAFCACTWRATEGCTYCDARDERFATLVPDRSRPGRRLELCRACSGFLKTLDVESITPFPLVAIEDLGSSDLDQAARHHGYTRRPLPQL